MKTTTATDYQERILRALLYIQAHLDEPLELEALARAACFSPFHFHRVFRAMVGEAVYEHVRRLRLERAAVTLRQQPGRPVIEIALAAGYDSHEAFSRAFHSMFDNSPTQYRAGGNQPAPESPSGVHFANASGYHQPDTGAAPPVEIKTLAPQRIVFLRHVGPYANVGPTWEKLCSWAGQRGLMGPNTKFLGLSHDDPQVTPGEKLRYDAAITVDRPVEPSGEFGVMELPGGEYATLLHKGPYENLTSSYAALFGAWMPASGREMRNSPGFELYVNSPDTASPENLLTLIHVPLE